MGVGEVGVGGGGRLGSPHVDTSGKENELF